MTFRHHHDASFVLPQVDRQGEALRREMLAACAEGLSVRRLPPHLGNLLLDKRPLMMLHVRFPPSNQPPESGGAAPVARGADRPSPNLVSPRKWGGRACGVMRA
jgi:hypothetical protein